MWVCFEDVVCVMGVLFKMVLCVFNEELLVKEFMCQCVFVVMEQMNYCFSFVVCGLVGSCLFLVVMFYDNNDNFVFIYLVEIQDGVFEVCNVNCYFMMVCLLCMWVQDFICCVDVLVVDYYIDGVIVILLFIDNVVLLCCLKEYSVLYVSILLLCCEYVIGVCMDEQQVVKVLVGELVKLGYWCIVYIVGIVDYGVSCWCFNGYKEVLVEVGLLFDLDYVVQGQFIFGFGVFVVCELFLWLILFMVIFVVNDDMVVGVMWVVNECGLKVLCDLLVCGFDDILLVIQLWLLLIIVCQFSCEMGKFVIEQLMEVLCGCGNGLLLQVLYMLQMCELMVVVLG